MGLTQQNLGVSTVIRLCWDTSFGHIDNAAQDVLAVAKSTRQPVYLVFNEILILVHPEQAWPEVVTEYWSKSEERYKAYQALKGVSHVASTS